MARARVMAALVILDAVKSDLLPGLGEDAPEIVWDPTAALIKRLENGETADGIFAIDASIQRLVAEGRLRPETVVPVVQAEFGFAMPEGSGLTLPRDAAGVIALLRSVPSVAMSRAGASGIYFETLIDRLGIGDEVRAKAVIIPAGLTGEKLLTGEAALAFQQMSELKAVPGIDILGPLPDDCQQFTDFSAAIFTDAAFPDAAQRFVDLLRSPEAARSYVARGLKLRF
ncbi:solute-binding protein [Rhodobacterales bacterium HKCCE2091]|nr:solute-binding protein [Rhodobacterales bacterium HKCCE2091]